MVGPALLRVCLVFVVNGVIILIGCHYFFPDIFTCLRYEFGKTLDRNSIDRMLALVMQTARSLAQLKAGENFLYIMDEAQELSSVSVNWELINPADTCKYICALCIWTDSVLWSCTLINCCLLALALILFTASQQPLCIPPAIAMLCGENVKANGMCCSL